MPSESKTNRGPNAGPENRRALVDAAREVFAESGFLAPLSSVARRAGVGQGSLYRHFPDRVSLAVAVFDDNVVELESLADGPDATLADLFDRVAEQAIGSAALIEMLSTHRHDARAIPLEARVVALVDELLARDKASGRVAARVSADDIMLAISMLAFVVAKADADDRPSVATRAQAVFRAAFSG